MDWIRSPSTYGTRRDSGLHNTASQLRAGGLVQRRFTHTSARAHRWLADLLQRHNCGVLKAQCPLCGCPTHHESAWRCRPCSVSFGGCHRERLLNDSVSNAHIAKTQSPDWWVVPLSERTTPACESHAVLHIASRATGKRFPMQLINRRSHRRSQRRILLGSRRNHNGRGRPMVRRQRTCCSCRSRRAGSCRSRLAPNTLPRRTN
jgi:hypothetical protein